MEVNLTTCMFGKSKEGSEQFLEKVANQKRKQRLSKEISEDKCNFLKNKEVETQAFSQQSPKEFKDTWGFVVVCERQIVHQSGKVIDGCLSRWLSRSMELVPYQNNINFFLSARFVRRHRRLLNRVNSQKMGNQRSFSLSVLMI